MPLTDPVPAYVALDNMDAHLVCSVLNSAGLEAAVVDDLSAVTLTQVLRPKVYINRADIERARPVLEDYLNTREEPRFDESQPGMIDVSCEECGATTSFPVWQRGTVQVCPNCQAYVDVGSDEPFDDWKGAPSDEVDGG